MKKLASILLAVLGLMAFQAVQANQNITNNTNCTYVVRVIFGPFACSVSSTTLVTVGPNSTVIVPCPPGEFPIATVVAETVPGGVPRVLVGDPFCGFSSGLNAYGNCGATLQYFIGNATNFLTIN